MNSVFEEALTDLEARLTKIGLYMVSTDYGAVPVSEEAIEEIIEEDLAPEDSFKQGKTKLFLNAVFAIGDIAFSERVLHPELFDEKRQFNLVAPTEAEIELESLKDDLMNWDDE